MNWMVLMRRIGGTAVFILGIVALVLPVLPGWLLIGVGLYILSLDSPGMQGRIRALRARYPHAHKIMTEVEHRMGHKSTTSPDAQKGEVAQSVTPPEHKV